MSMIYTRAQQPNGIAPATIWVGSDRRTHIKLKNVRVCDDQETFSHQSDGNDGKPLSTLEGPVDATSKPATWAK